MGHCYGDFTVYEYILLLHSVYYCILSELQLQNLNKLEQSCLNL